MKIPYDARNSYFIHLCTECKDSMQYSGTENHQERSLYWAHLPGISQTLLMSLLSLFPGHNQLNQEIRRQRAEVGRTVKYIHVWHPAVQKSVKDGHSPWPRKRIRSHCLKTDNRVHGTQELLHTEEHLSLVQLEGDSPKYQLCSALKSLMKFYLCVGT